MRILRTTERQNAIEETKETVAIPSNEEGERGGPGKESSEVGCLQEERAEIKSIHVTVNRKLIRIDSQLKGTSKKGRGKGREGKGVLSKYRELLDVGESFKKGKN